MRKFFEIAGKLPKTKMEFIIVIMVAGLGSVVLNWLIERVLPGSVRAKVLFLLGFMGALLLGVIVDYRHIRKKARNVLTREELTYYLTVYYVIIAVALALVGILVFLV